MLASHSCFILLKNSFSESARISLEWSTISTSFSSAGDSSIGIQSPVWVPSYRTFSSSVGNRGPGFPCKAPRKLLRFLTLVILPRNMERIYPSCSHESESHWSWASHSSSEGSPLRVGSPASSKVSRSGIGWGLALPSRMQVHRTNASRAIGLPPQDADKSVRATHLLHAVRIYQYLTGFASLQPLHGLRKILHRNAVGDHGMQVELAGLEQCGHLIPRLIHAASVDALHRDALENNVFGEVQRDGLGGQAEEGNSSTAPHDI